jgi:hypothetical protein
LFLGAAWLLGILPPFLGTLLMVWGMFTMEYETGRIQPPGTDQIEIGPHNLVVSDAHSQTELAE